MKLFLFRLKFKVFFICSTIGIHLITFTIEHTFCGMFYSEAYCCSALNRKQPVLFGATVGSIYYVCFISVLINM